MFRQDTFHFWVKKQLKKRVQKEMMMLYRIRAYKSRVEGESGRLSPLNTSSTMDFKTAEHTAKALAKEYGSAVIENTETGNRVWY